jgi:DNA-binding transcriptional LysR family regulator
MPLSLQDLQDIAAICEAGSFRKAAERMGVTQPTLSGRVRQMEKRLGATLFERSRGRSRPTRLALTIAEQSSGALRQANSLVRQAQRMSEGSRGLVRIGAAPIPFYSFVGQIIERAIGEAPELTLVVRSGNVGTLLDLLDHGEVDLVLGAGGPDLLTPRLDSEALTQDELLAVMRPEHPLAGRAKAPMREVFKHPLAIPVLDPLYRRVTSELVGVDVTTLPAMVFCSNLWVLKALVDTGRYATVCPAFCFSDALERGDYVKVSFSESQTHQIWLYNSRHALPLPAVQQVTKIIRTLSAEIRLEIARRND